jgi:hypothetical protein
MPNTFSNLVPDAYAALTVVSRELVGLIPSINRDSNADAIPIGQTLRSAVAPVNTAGRDATPAMAFPAAAYQTITNKSITITKSRAFPFSWQGDEQAAINRGPGFLTVQQQQIAQAMRAAVAEVSTDVFVAMRAGASRAYGTAATTPFASDLSGSAQMKKILDDNGTPASDRSLVLDTTAGAALRTLLNNTLNANNSLNVDATRNGVLIDTNGFAIREDAKIVSTTKGTGTGWLANGTAAVGDTSITIDTGTGTILAGDFITVNTSGDTNKYMVTTSITTGATTLTIAEPGLRVALADNATITVGGTATANLAFSRDFATLATRTVYFPKEGDLAIMREVITDPVSGLSFGLVVWPGARMVTYEIELAWGVSVFNPTHGAVLLG